MSRTGLSGSDGHALLAPQLAGATHRSNSEVGGRLVEFNGRSAVPQRRHVFKPSPNHFTS